jgi:spore coat polysaccharide biosynthesis protein SpsF (cytidylyltransferase family)
MINKNFAIVIQIRNGSTRLPGKALMRYKNKTLIEIMLKRLLTTFKSKQIYLITTKLKQDDILIEISKKFKIKTFRGFKNNVIKRYIQAASLYNIENIVRLTGDCPLVDPKLIKKMTSNFFMRNLDYYSNCYPYDKRFFPVGSDVEIFKTEVLKKIYKSKPTAYEKEHVTTKILKYYKKFKCEIYKTKKNFSKIRYTLDYYNDFEVIIKILSYLDKKKIFGHYNEIISFLIKNPKLTKYNKKFVNIYYKTKVINY